ncbi:unnamed protein product [Periconia digitata]|uniref:Uncharacterized protein n=1 Tax=Periconia digitata TaxID=1303443 RepID=A0A9W4UD24_9PLEO|nr:unnamed protein product [Periconia digitata]
MCCDATPTWVHSTILSALAHVLLVACLVPLPSQTYLFSLPLHVVRLHICCTHHLVHIAHAKMLNDVELNRWLSELPRVQPTFYPSPIPIINHPVPCCCPCGGVTGGQLHVANQKKSRYTKKKRRQKVTQGREKSSLSGRVAARQEFSASHHQLTLFLCEPRLETCPTVIHSCFSVCLLPSLTSSFNKNHL